MAHTSHPSRRPAAAFLIAGALAIGAYSTAFAQADSATPVIDTSLVTDTTRSVPIATDSMEFDTLAWREQERLLAESSWTRLMPPSRWKSDKQKRQAALLAGPSWPMPPVTAVAGSDFADWLSYHPAYDVADAPGVGQNRLFTHWGLTDRTGQWQVDGQSVSWQRLSFPMTPQFDPAVVPSYSFKSPHVGDNVILTRDTAWDVRPIFDFTFLQGDFSDTYSEGYFRAHTKRGFGLDVSGVFFSSDGRFGSDNRDKRVLSLQTFGPLKKNLYWRAHYQQFRDKSFVLTPAPFDAAHPHRNDLLWSGEAAIAHIVDSIPQWTIGACVQSGDQRMHDRSYSIASEDRNWQIFGETRLVGWDVDMSTGLEQLEIDSTDADRWYAVAHASHGWMFGDTWKAALRITGSDFDTDPPALGLTAALAPVDPVTWRPSIRLWRERVTPTLFDRERPLAEYSLINSGNQGFLYSEAGDPSLDDQWENAIGLQWGSDAISDSTKFGWTIAGHAAYIENFTIWQASQDIDSLFGNPVLHYRYRPRSEDARAFGAAFGLHGKLVGKLHYLTNYAVKYAADLDNEKLSGYYPHKGMAMLSFIAPKWKYGVDVRLNAAGLWWYGDERIDPTGYTSSHVFRLDFSGSARIVGDLTIFASMQNAANFPYRSAAGYPFTGRTMRFGIHVTLFD